MIMIYAAFHKLNYTDTCRLQFGSMGDPVFSQKRWWRSSTDREEESEARQGPLSLSLSAPTTFDTASVRGKCFHQPGFGTVNRVTELSSLLRKK